MKTRVMVDNEDSMDAAKCPFCGHVAMIHFLDGIDGDFTESNRNCRHYARYDGCYITFNSDN